MNQTGNIIGIDFDNTIVSYDDLMHKVAVQQGLISDRTLKSKKSIRDTIRQLTDGEIKWQNLQGIVYGQQMAEAKLIEGVSNFFKQCRQFQIPTYIVSHKTEYQALDETKTNLRFAALSWMESNGFFESSGLGLSQKSVYFESTRSEKVVRITQLECTHFIDDLEETFLENSFPDSVNKILYDPHKLASNYLPGLQVVNSWREINEYFFN